MSVNCIILVGNLGADPELRYTSQGTPVCQFRMATNTRVKKGSEWVQQATWYRVTTFGKQAESCSQYLVKGREVYVQGEHRTDEWVDRDGKARYTNEVVADKVKFIGSRGDREHSEAMSDDAQKQRGSEPDQHPDLSDDDIPF